MGALRFLLRLTGTCIIAAGFVALIIDGTRSIADGSLLLTPFSEVLAGIGGQSFDTIQSWIREHAAAWLWDPVTLWILAKPGFAVLAVVGAVLVVLGRRPRRHRLDLEYA